MGAYEYVFEYDFSLGDINFDNEINILDVVLMVSFILGEPTDEYELLASDINQDGGIGGIQALTTFSEKNGENENYLTMISNFTEAALRRNNNDLKNSLEIYSVIINGDIDITYKDYAKIQSAEVLMELKNYKEAKVFLSEVTGSLFSNIAKEYTGYIELYEGNTSKAKDIFQEIVDDASVQNTIKDRIKEILVTLK